jgi:hypothetical protein
MEYLSFQTPALAGVRVLGGEVGFADARQVVACICEDIDHGRPVSD